MKIILSHRFPPIPVRDHDWVAYIYGEEESTGRYGWGATAKAALLDLIENNEERFLE